MVPVRRSQPGLERTEEEAALLDAPAGRYPMSPGSFSQAASTVLTMKHDTNLVSMLQSTVIEDSSRTSRSVNQTNTPKVLSDSLSPVVRESTKAFVTFVYRNTHPAVPLYWSVDRSIRDRAMIRLDGPHRR